MPSYHRSAISIRDWMWKEISENEEEYLNGDRAEKLAQKAYESLAPMQPTENKAPPAFVDLAEDLLNDYMMMVGDMERDRSGLFASTRFSTYIDGISSMQTAAASRKVSVSTDKVAYIWVNYQGEPIQLYIALLEDGDEKETLDMLAETIEEDWSEDLETGVGFGDEGVASLYTLLKGNSLEEAVRQLDYADVAVLDTPVPISGSRKRSFIDTSKQRGPMRREESFVEMDQIWNYEEWEEFPYKVIFSGDGGVEWEVIDGAYDSEEAEELAKEYMLALPREYMVEIDH